MIIHLLIGLLVLLTYGIGIVGDWRNKSPDYITIEQLYDSCHVPGPCGEKIDCEGKMVRVKGYVDYDNVFNKKTYPQLPYEKFKIHDGKGKTLEVWVVSANSNKVFEKIYQNKAHLLEKMVFIKGIIIGFDMPVMGGCHRGIMIKIEEEHDISFD